MKTIYKKKERNNKRKKERKNTSGSFTRKLIRK